MTEYTKADLEKIGRRWLDRIKAVEKRDEDWIKDATRAEAIYLCDEKEEADQPYFNILHSNVETIVPAIINSDPMPDIRRKFNINREDPVGKAVADIIERGLLVQQDDDALASECELAAQDVFVAGLGLVRPRFDADDVPAQSAIQPIVIGVDEDGPIIEEQEVEVAPAGIENERILFDVVAWKDYRQGPAKRWRDVPWTAYRHEITDDERKRLEDEQIAAVYGSDYGDMQEEDLTCTIWEIWCKETMKVYFIMCESGKVLSIEDDPLGLKGFFPHGEPIIPIRSTANLKPVCPYKAYERLAKEIDQATKRIHKIMSGMKVRGLIAGDADVFDLLAELGDNELRPVANLENLVAAGGLDRAVMWWPIETAAAVVKFLYEQREQSKQAVYEVTGISDIVRGATNAQETARAQSIKAEWGSLRIKKMQRMLERHIRDTYVICAEMLCKHFSPATLQRMTGVQITPEIAQVLAGGLDEYRIDIETDSTIRADLTKSRAEMSQFLEGTANFFATMSPVVQTAPESAGPLAKMYAAFASQFQLGKNAEDALDQFVEMAEQASKQPQDKPDPEMELKLKEMEGRYMLEIEKLKLQAQNLQLDGQIKGAELLIKREELGIRANDSQVNEAKAEADAAARFAELDLEKEQERPVKIGN